MLSLGYLWCDLQPMTKSLRLLETLVTRGTKYERDHAFAYTWTPSASISMQKMTRNCYVTILLHKTWLSERSKKIRNSNRFDRKTRKLTTRWVTASAKIAAQIFWITQFKFSFYRVFVNEDRPLLQTRTITDISNWNELDTPFYRVPVCTHFADNAWFPEWLGQSEIDGREHINVLWKFVKIQSGSSCSNAG